MENNQLKYHQLKNKLIGEILQEAGFVNSDQVAVALMEQSFYTHLKLGEILALHGWVNQELVDFFAERIQLPPKKKQKNRGILTRSRVIDGKRYSGNFKRTAQIWG